MIEGLSHITLVTSDLDRMAALLTDVLDAKQVYDSGDNTHSLSRERFFIVGGIWLAIMEGESVPEKTYNHVAFKIPDEKLDLYVARLEKAGVEIRTDRSRIAGEARSIYFHDDDNHLFELHTGTLSERLMAYASLGDT